MKYPIQTLRLALVGLLACAALSARAQVPSAGGGKRYIPFKVTLHRDWQITLNDPVRLFDVGPVSEDRQSNRIVLLVGGPRRTDPQRELRVTHLDGTRLVVDYTTNVTGSVSDALLLGHFRTAKAGAAPQTASAGKPAKGKNSPMPTRQIVTGEGVYEWQGKGLLRLFPAPADVRLALSRDRANDLLVCGVGTAAMPYEIGDTDARPATLDSLGDTGYVRMGFGAQETPDRPNTFNLLNNVRCVQSLWNGRDKWLVGVQRGTPLTGWPDVTGATTNDVLIVYTPRYASRDKAFWACNSSDLDESWRSEALSGQVLDVRIGDPRNDGHDGLLVLTADNNDRERRLTFYSLAANQTGG